MLKKSYDAVVVGSGPNGLACAIELAREGWVVAVLEAADSVGGATRTAELTQPGFRHDIGSAIHPMAVGSPFLSGLPLSKYGLEWISPEVALAHPLDDGTAVLLLRSVKATAESLAKDSTQYRRFMKPMVEHWEGLARDILAPMHMPRHPWLIFTFGLRAMRSVEGLAESMFVDQRAGALLAGMGAHSIMPLDKLGSAAIALVMCITGHAVGWPMARGGSQSIADAMAAHLRSLGGEIFTGSRVDSLDSLPEARAVMLDITPRQFLSLAPGMPQRECGRMGNYPYGPGVFKVDWALESPVPWKAADCLRSATVHLGGTLKEIVAAESAVFRGQHPEHPFVVLAQHTLFDPTRAPEGKHTAWAYCHIPHGSTVDMTDRIESQIERFAPGFRQRILARRSMAPADLESENANLVGGDISGGLNTLKRIFRPGFGHGPYGTPLKSVFLCSSSTPPGAGVHGMCGYHAARAAMRIFVP